MSHGPASCPGSSNSGTQDLTAQEPLRHAFHVPGGKRVIIGRVLLTEQHISLRRGGLLHAGPPMHKHPATTSEDDLHTIFVTNQRFTRDAPLDEGSLTWGEAGDVGQLAITTASSGHRRLDRGIVRRRHDNFDGVGPLGLQLSKVVVVCSVHGLLLVSGSITPIALSSCSSRNCAPLSLHPRLPVLDTTLLAWLHFSRAARALYPLFSAFIDRSGGTR